MMVQISLKFCKATSSNAIEECFKQIPDITGITQVFPDEKVSELAYMYVVEVESSVVKQTLEKLQQNLVVEYAQEAPSRKPF